MYFGAECIWLSWGGAKFGSTKNSFSFQWRVQLLADIDCEVEGKDETIKELKSQIAKLSRVFMNVTPASATAQLATNNQEDEVRASPR